MKLFTFLTFLLVSFCTTIYAQNGAIGIGTENPNAKSILDIYSTEKGLLIPRLTLTQRDALQVNGTTNAAINGLLIYNTSSNKFNVWNLNKWDELSTTTGVKGDQGEKGEKGDKGDTGAVGPQGLQGSKGDKGTDGATGAQGPKGDVGLTGLNGAAWFNGNLNPPVSASEPTDAKDGDYYLNNNNGKVFIKNKGVWQEVANLTTGVVGPVGPAGAQWYNGTLNPPSNANEPSGVKEGDLYLNNSTGDVFKRSASGTWALIANLTTGIVGPQGPQGAKGDKGDKGDVGVAGPQGAVGAIGPQGAKGDKGDKGDVGAAGPQGAVGATGPQGPQGSKGDKGDTGAAGPAGAQGPIGLTGPAGPQGVQGDPGEQGPVGPAGPSGTAAAWMRTGNGAGFTGGTTNPGVNNDFVGTTDAKELIIASNRNEGLRIATDGKVRIGVAGSYITSISKISAVADLPSIAAKASFKQNFTLAGVGANASVAISSSIELPDGLLIAYARVVSANTVEVKFINVSDLAINLPSATFHISAIQ